MLHFTMNGGWLKASVSLLLGCLLFVATPRCEAQDLVPNPSFEEYVQCPSNAGFVEDSRPLHWNTWRSSPDYFNSCAGLGQLDPTYSVPFNAVAFQFPQEGEAYAGLVAYSQFDEYREYIGVALNEPLSIGHTYSVSFWVNLAFGGQYEITTAGCNNVGLLFTNMDMDHFANYAGTLVFRNNAHVRAEEVLLDTLAWTEVEGEFTADSAYQFLVIGNFFENDLTEHQPLFASFQEVSYLLVDNVSVAERSTSVPEVELELAPYCAFDPMAEQLLINWPGLSGFDAAVFDPFGRIVLIKRSVASEIHVPTTGWPSGVYFGKLQRGSISSFVKFVVQ